MLGAPYTLETLNITDCENLKSLRNPWRVPTEPRLRNTDIEKGLRLIVQNQLTKIICEVF
jgi:hypothetical protein